MIFTHPNGDRCYDTECTDRHDVQDHGIIYPAIAVKPGTSGGYIPEGGVWTDAERSRWIPRLTSDGATDSTFVKISAGEIRSAVSTVAALIRALEALANMVESGGDVQDMDREDAIDVILDARAEVMDSRALLAAVKGEK